MKYRSKGRWKIHFKHLLVAAWLPKKDDVLKRTGQPTWSSLADALKRTGQADLAEKIITKRMEQRSKKGMHLMCMHACAFNIHLCVLLRLNVMN